MKVLIAGLSDQSAAAMERVIGAVYPGAQVIRQQRGVGVDSPQAWAVAQSCDLRIVDLIGLGLARWTHERQQQLQASVLSDHCAIVLAPPGDGGGWLQALQASGAARLTLQHPLRATTMRNTLHELRAQDESAAQATAEALLRASRPPEQTAWQTAPQALPSLASVRVVLPEPVELHDALDDVPLLDAVPVAEGPELPPPGPQAEATPAPSPTPPPPAQASPAAPRRGRGRLGAPLPPAWDEAPETFSVVPDETARPEPEPGLATTLAQPDAFGLTAEGLQALQAVCPEASHNAYLNLICEAALKSEPQEFQIGSHSGIVVNAAQNWVVSNISSALRKRLTAHAMMLQIVESRALPHDQAFATAVRLFGRRQDGRRPLDTFVWGLAYSTFESAPPQATGDLRFQLRRFPNFTRMVAQPDLFIQLALLCLHSAQSLHDLQRRFSRHDPRLVTLFMLCAVLSGTASVLPVVPEAAASPVEAPAPAQRRNLPGFGFIRSLLDRLF